MNVFKSIPVLILTVVIGINKLNAQEISVFTGFWGPEYFQDDQEITKDEAKSLLLNYSESHPFWKKKMLNEGLFYGTYVISLGSAFWLGTELGKNNNEGDITAPLTATLGSFVISMVFLNSANKNGRKAILAYNKQFDKRTTNFYLEPVLNSNGLGLALKF